MPLTSQWTEREDQRLRELVAEYGQKKWSLIASKLGTKGSKQVRRRWKNYLNADNKQGGWSPEEDRVLMEGHQLYGNKWTEIAKMVGGRTDNAVKNRWAALCKRNERPPGGAKRGRKRQNPDVGGRRRRSASPDLDSDEDHTSTSSSEEEKGFGGSKSGRRALSRGRGGTAAAAAAAAAAGHPPQPAHTQDAHPPSKRLRLAGASSMDASEPDANARGSITASGPSQRGSAAHRSGQLDSAPKSSSPPTRYQDLTLLIPNAAADPPTSAPASRPSMEVRVFKDLLSPAERQIALELNSMDIPLHINIEDGPLTTSRRAQQEAIHALIEGSPAHAPLTLSGCVPPGGLPTFSSASLPSAHLLPSTTSQPDQFNELLKWLSSGVTPHSTKTPAGQGGVSRTPLGGAGGAASRLGPGSSPTTRSRIGQQQQQQQLREGQQQQQQQQQPHSGATPSRAGAPLQQGGGPSGEVAFSEGHLQLLGRLFGSVQQSAEKATSSASPSPSPAMGSNGPAQPLPSLSVTGHGLAFPGDTGILAKQRQQQQQQQHNYHQQQQQHHHHQHQPEQQHQQQRQPFTPCVVDASGLGFLANGPWLMGDQQQQHPGRVGHLNLVPPTQQPPSSISMPASDTGGGRPSSDNVWQHIDVLTTPLLSAPELSLLLDALNGTD